MDVPITDNTKLKEIIRRLCATKKRTPLTMERIKIWLKQFTTPEEQTLALLILKNLIYRTTAQIESCLRQALKEAALHFEPPNTDEVDYEWRNVLANYPTSRSGFFFYFAPPILGSLAAPGKSGELIARLLHSKFGIQRSFQTYCEDRKLADDEYFLIVDDGSFTGTQICDVLRQCGPLMQDHNRGGIVLSIAHEEAIKEFKIKLPNVRVFCGELLTEKDNFKQTCEAWVNNKIWPHEGFDPHALYMDIATRAGMSDTASGWGKLGLLVVYEHGIPDNTLPLLWERTSNWEPLFER